MTFMEYYGMGIVTIEDTVMSLKTDTKILLSFSTNTNTELSVQNL